MTWVIIKADLYWWLITLPVLIGINVLSALRARSAARKVAQTMPAWARGERTPEQRFKVAAMRRRRRRA